LNINDDVQRQCYYVRKKVRYGRSTTTKEKEWLNSVMSVELKPTCPKSNNTNKY